MELTKRIKELRENAGMTQEELAQKVGVQRNTVWRWENKKASLKADMFNKIVSLLDKSSEIVSGEQDNKQHSLEKDKMNIQSSRILYNYGNHHFEFPATSEGYKAFYETLSAMTKIEIASRTGNLHADVSNT